MTLNQQINPTHTIPTIVDNNQGGFALWESKAIITYLINQYSPGHKLYPTDPKIRASIDKILYFDIGTLYPAQAPLVYPLLMGDGVVDPSKLQPYQDKLAFLNGFLSDSKYVAGTDHYTVADLCILASLGLGKAVNLDWSSHPNVIEWFDRMRGEVPYDDILENGITVIKNWAEAKQKKD